MMKEFNEEQSMEDDLDGHELDVKTAVALDGGAVTSSSSLSSSRQTKTSASSSQSNTNGPSSDARIIAMTTKEVSDLETLFIFVI